MFAELFQPVSASAEEIGIEAVAEVGPGGHFFAAAHTMQRYRDAFYTPLVSDWRNFGAWTDGGAKTATERAGIVWRANARRVPAAADRSGRSARHLPPSSSAAARKAERRRFHSIELRGLIGEPMIVASSYPGYPTRVPQSMMQKRTEMA